jgi:hypothetical protein
VAKPVFGLMPNYYPSILAIKMGSKLEGAKYYSQ